MTKPRVFVLALILLAQSVNYLTSQTVFEIQPEVSYVTSTTFNPAPGPGDTVKILSDRIERLKFVGLKGSQEQPIIFINSGGQVHIQTTAWGALEFLDCQHIKVTGTGDSAFPYGFLLKGIDCGLAFSGYSSDCEAEFIEITGDEEVFFGVYAKKDFGGNPPVPYPQFLNLVLHDLLIHEVSEGMYIGETKSPGMEFRNVRIYNNIIYNTHRECIQIANCVENIEIYNNLMFNAGLHHLAGQENLLQIGGNSVAQVYNNILIQSPAYGIINLGMGNITLFNNYLENNLGVFSDDRYWTLDQAPIEIDQNYFVQTTGPEIIRNMNQYNPLYITNNQYNTDIPFFNNLVDGPADLVVEQNNRSPIPSLNYILENGKFLPDPNNIPEYRDLGPRYGQKKEPKRIILNRAQLSDLVFRGSSTAPLYLVDEQDLDPELNQHPVSKSWVPAKNTRFAPYQVVIDLGQEYYLDRIYFHDQKGSGDLVLSYLGPSGWEIAAIDPCINRNTWNLHQMGFQTQFLMLSMNTSTSAAINEIALYGYGTESLPLKKENAAENFRANPSLEAPNEIALFPCPADNFIQINSQNPILESRIFDLKGKEVLRTKNTGIDLSKLVPGTYFIRIQESKSDQLHSRKFIISR